MFRVGNASCLLDQTAAVFKQAGVQLRQFSPVSNRLSVTEQQLILEISLGMASSSYRDCQTRVDQIG